MKYLKPLKKAVKLSGNQHGFGLVETLVAVAILGLTAAAFLTSLSTGSAATRINRESAIARWLAGEQLEAIRASEYDASGVSYRTVEQPEGYSVDIDTAPAGGSGIQKVTVTISHEGELLLTLSDYKVNR